MAVVPPGNGAPSHTMEMTELVENAAESWNLGRVIISGENPWFRGKDVATSLAYKDQRRALQKHVRSKHKTTFEDLLQKGETDCTSPSQNQPFPKSALANQQPHELYVNEPGLYSLIFRSKLPKAEAFTDWVTEEVLPAIRRTSRYVHGDSTKSNDFVEMPPENWAEMAKLVAPFASAAHPVRWGTAALLSEVGTLTGTCTCPGCPLPCRLSKAGRRS